MVQPSPRTPSVNQQTFIEHIPLSKKRSLRQAFFHLKLTTWLGVRVRRCSGESICWPPGGHQEYSRRQSGETGLSSHWTLGRGLGQGSAGCAHETVSKKLLSCALPGVVMLATLAACDNEELVWVGNCFTLPIRSSKALGRKPRTPPRTTYSLCCKLYWGLWNPLYNTLMTVGPSQSSCTEYHNPKRGSVMT